MFLRRSVLDRIRHRASSTSECRLESDVVDFEIQMAREAVGVGSEKPDVLLLKAILPDTMRALEERFTLRRLDLAPDKDDLLRAVASRVRVVVAGGQAMAGAELFARLRRWRSSRTSVSATTPSMSSKPHGGASW